MGSILHTDNDDDDDDIIITSPDYPRDISSGHSLSHSFQSKTMFRCPSGENGLRKEKGEPRGM